MLGISRHTLQRYVKETKPRPVWELWLCRPATRKGAHTRRLRPELRDYGFQTGRGL